LDVCGIPKGAYWSGICLDKKGATALFDDVRVAGVLGFILSQFSCIDCSPSSIAPASSTPCSSLSIFESDGTSVPDGFLGRRWLATSTDWRKVSDAIKLDRW